MIVNSMPYTPILAALLTGRAPAFDIYGSFFPAWLLCILLGLLFAMATHWLLLRVRVPLVLPLVTYPCLAALFTFALWLRFFR